ncbi:MAG: 30S ribosomal protein S16, partial [Schleiferiaceae bacterium]
MATRIRLQRHGRKGRPIFTIVVADSRATRDGKFIEDLGADSLDIVELVM